jgi:hypothetical protein
MQGHLEHDKRPERAAASSRAVRTRWYVESRSSDVSEDACGSRESKRDTLIQDRAEHADDFLRSNSLFWFEVILVEIKVNPAAINNHYWHQLLPPFERISRQGLRHRQKWAQDLFLFLGQSYFSRD